MIINRIYHRGCNVPYLRRPDPDHTPEWYQYCEDVGDNKLYTISVSLCLAVKHTYHLLCADLPVSLNVPKAKRTRCRCDSLRQTQIRVLQKAEFEFIVLANGNESSCGVQPLYTSLHLLVCRYRYRCTHIGQEEEREEVHERIWQFLVLFSRQPNLLPTDR